MRNPRQGETGVQRGVGLCVKGVWGQSREPKGNWDFEERVEPSGGRVGAHTEREARDTSGRMSCSVLAKF